MSESDNEAAEPEPSDIFEAIRDWDIQDEPVSTHVRSEDLTHGQPAIVQATLEATGPHGQAPDEPALFDLFDVLATPGDPSRLRIAGLEGDPEAVDTIRKQHGDGILDDTRHYIGRWEGVVPASPVTAWDIDHAIRYWAIDVAGNLEEAWGLEQQHCQVSYARLYQAWDIEPPGSVLRRTLVDQPRPLPRTDEIDAPRWWYIDLYADALQALIGRDGREVLIERFKGPDRDQAFLSLTALELADHVYDKMGEMA